MPKVRVYNNNGRMRKTSRAGSYTRDLIIGEAPKGCTPALRVDTKPSYINILCHDQNSFHNQTPSIHHKSKNMFYFEWKKDALITLRKEFSVFGNVTEQARENGKDVEGRSQGRHRLLPPQK